MFQTAMGIAALCLFLLIAFPVIMVWEILIRLLWPGLLLSCLLVNIMCIGVAANIPICLRIVGTLYMKMAVFVLPPPSWSPTIHTPAAVVNIHGLRVQIATFLYLRAITLYGRIWETTRN